MGKSTLSRLGAGRESSFFIVSRPQLETPVCQRRTCPRYNDEIHCTSSPARDWARSHEIYSREERPIRNVSTVASKSRTPPETAARVLIGAITEPGRAMPALERGKAGSPQGLTYRGLNSLCSLVVNHRTVSANGCGRTQTKMS